MPHKLKNPEKYIKRLKRRLKWAEEMRDRNYKDYLRAIGTMLCRYSEGVTKGVSGISVTSARCIRINSEIIIRGRVTEIKMNGKGTVDLTFSLGEVRYND